MPDTWLERAAALRPHRVAVETPEGGLTYADLLARARTLPARPGAPLHIDEPPGLGFAVALHACLLHGAVAVPVDPRLAPPEQERARATRPDAVPGAALVVHTSGTTGAPKPVTLTRANLQASALGSAVALGLDREERWLCPLPLSHVGGLMVLVRSVIYATTAVLAPHDDGATLASLVPTQLQRLLDAGTPPPPRLRAVLLGGAPAARSLLERARDAGWPVCATYGLTQACSSVTVSEPGDVETAGAPLPGTRVSIAPDGEIVVDGATVAGGRALRTGDLGRLDDRGRLIVVGRRSDTIVTGGENVAPAEVEAVLLEHPAVADAAVIGRADAEWGEAVTALIVARDGALDADAVRAHCAERLARFKVPKRFEVVATLPRTASGKLLRRELA
jgi:O-succinylbenzoic acid--CoA ligase